MILLLLKFVCNHNKCLQKHLASHKNYFLIKRYAVSQLSKTSVSEFPIVMLKIIIEHSLKNKHLYTISRENKNLNLNSKPIAHRKIAKLVYIQCACKVCRTCFWYRSILQNASPAELISLHKHILTKCRSHNSEREDNNLPLPDYVYGIFELQTVATNNIFNF